MDEIKMEEMAKAYHEALKDVKFPKTRPFPDAAATRGSTEIAKNAEDDRQTDKETIACLLVRELAAVEFLLQCAVKEEKTRLLTYLRSLLYEVMRRYPAATKTMPTDRYLSPETAKLRLSEYTLDRLVETERAPRDAELYAINSRILALNTLI